MTSSFTLLVRRLANEVAPMFPFFIHRLEIKIMKVTMRTLSTIRPYENNPRINKAAIEAVAKSILEFGFRQPIVVDELGAIIAGHTRFFCSPAFKSSSSCQSMWRVV